MGKEPGNPRDCQTSRPKSGRRCPMLDVVQIRRREGRILRKATPSLTTRHEVIRHSDIRSQRSHSVRILKPGGESTNTYTPYPRLTRSSHPIIITPFVLHLSKSYFMHSSPLQHPCRLATSWLSSSSQPLQHLFSTRCIVRSV